MIIIIFQVQFKSTIILVLTLIVLTVLDIFLNKFILCTL